MQGLQRVWLQAAQSLGHEDQEDVVGDAEPGTVVRLVQALLEHAGEAVRVSLPRLIGAESTGEGLQQLGRKRHGRSIASFAREQSRTAVAGARSSFDRRRDNPDEGGPSQ
jgi:hypothetical protein